MQSVHLSPWMLDLQEHIPDALHDADIEPCTSQLQAGNIKWEIYSFGINILKWFSYLPEQVGKL